MKDLDPYIPEDRAVLEDSLRNNGQWKETYPLKWAGVEIGSPGEVPPDAVTTRSYLELLCNGLDDATAELDSCQFSPNCTCVWGDCAPPWQAMAEAYTILHVCMANSALPWKHAIHEIVAWI